MSRSILQTQGTSTPKAVGATLVDDREALDARAGRAELGDRDAQFDLGLMYSSGDGVGLDYVTAHQWFNLAALGGHDEARTMRTEIARDMSLAEVAEAQRRARAWLRKHAH
jgi:TPR repeat protein